LPALLVYSTNILRVAAHLHHGWDIYNRYGRNQAALKRAVLTTGTFRIGDVRGHTLTTHFDLQLLSSAIRHFSERFARSCIFGRVRMRV